jgi:hypothetical protein
LFLRENASIPLKTLFISGELFGQVNQKLTAS